MPGGARRGRRAGAARGHHRCRWNRRPGGQRWRSGSRAGSGQQGLDKLAVGPRCCATVQAARHRVKSPTTTSNQVVMNNFWAWQTAHDHAPTARGPPPGPRAAARLRRLRHGGRRDLPSVPAVRGIEGRAAAGDAAGPRRGTARPPPPAGVVLPVRRDDAAGAPRAQVPGRAAAGRAARGRRRGTMAAGRAPAATSSSRSRSTQARRRERGYDQAALIAAVAAEQLRLPWRVGRGPGPGHHGPVPPRPAAPGGQRARRRSRSTRRRARPMQVAGSSSWTTSSRRGPRSARQPGAARRRRHGGERHHRGARTMSACDSSDRGLRPCGRAAASVAILEVRAEPDLQASPPHSQARRRREVTREDDRQGQEPRGPGPGPAVRGAQVRPPRAAPR